MPAGSRAYPATQTNAGAGYVALAVLLAVVLQAATMARSPAVENDGIVFIGIAKGLSTNPCATMREADQHPGYPAMILASQWLLGRFGVNDEVTKWLLAARLATGLCGAVSVPLVWLLARRAFDSRVAAVSAILFAVMPLFRQNAADAMSDSPHLLFFLLGVLAADVGFQRWRCRWFLGAGCASALAYWIRPEGLTVAVVAGALLTCCIFSKRRPKLWVLAACMAALGVSLIATAAPYVIIKGILTSKKDLRVVLEGASWRMDGAKEPASPAKRSPEPDRISDYQPTPPRAGPTATEDLSENKRTREQSRPKIAFPADLLIAALHEYIRQVAYGFYQILLAPLVVGVIASFRRKPPRTTCMIVATICVAYSGLLLFLYVIARYISHRHTMPIVSLAMPWVGYGSIQVANGIHWVVSRFVRPAARTGSRWALCVVLLAMCAVLVPRSLRPLHPSSIPLVEAAAWVRAHARPGDAVLSNSNYVPFYADMPGRVLTRHDKVPGAEDSGGSLRYRFVVLDMKIHNFNADWIPALESADTQVEPPRTQDERGRVLIFEAVTK